MEDQIVLSKSNKFIRKNTATFHCSTEVLRAHDFVKAFFVKAFWAKNEWIPKLSKIIEPENIAYMCIVSKNV